MPNVTTSIIPETTNHYLTLNDAEAYQIWFLSFKNEGGDDYPGYDGQRITFWFDDNTQDRFRWAKSRGVTPKQALDSPELLQ